MALWRYTGLSGSGQTNQDLLMHSSGSSPSGVVEHFRVYVLPLLFFSTTVIDSARSEPTACATRLV